MREVVERLSGRGKVLLGERQAAVAHYSITVWQEFIDTSTFEGKSRTEGMKSANGEMQVVEGPKDLEMALEWTLVLSDGRRCHCVLTNLSMPSASFKFNVSGAIA